MSEAISTLDRILDLIGSDKLTEIEAERLLNAAARLSSGTPTGDVRSNRP